MAALMNCVRLEGNFEKLLSSVPLECGTCPSWTVYGLRSVAELRRHLEDTGKASLAISCGRCRRLPSWLCRAAGEGGRRRRRPRRDDVLRGGVPSGRAIRHRDVQSVALSPQLHLLSVQWRALHVAASGADLRPPGGRRRSADAVRFGPRRRRASVTRDHASSPQTARGHSGATGQAACVRGCRRATGQRAGRAPRRRDARPPRHAAGGAGRRDRARAKARRGERVRGADDPRQPPGDADAGDGDDGAQHSPAAGAEPREAAAARAAEGTPASHAPILRRSNDASPPPQFFLEARQQKLFQDILVVYPITQGKSGEYSIRGIELPYDFRCVADLSPPSTPHRASLAHRLFCLSSAAAR